MKPKIQTKLLVFLIASLLVLPPACAFQEGPCCDFGYSEHFVQLRFYNFNNSLATNETVTIAPAEYYMDVERIFFFFYIPSTRLLPNVTQQRDFTTDKNGVIVFIANPDVPYNVKCRGYSFNAYLKNSAYTVGIPDCESTVVRGCL